MKRGKSVDFTGYWQRHIATSRISASNAIEFGYFFRRALVNSAFH
jgi:hypothetical protein